MHCILFDTVRQTEHQPNLEWIERKKLKATTSTNPIPEVNSSRSRSAHILTFPKPKELLKHCVFVASIGSNKEPQTFYEAIFLNLAGKQAMKVELDALHKNGTWGSSFHS